MNGVSPTSGVAVVSYPALPDVAVKDHILWGTMLLVLTICGPGKIAVDAWLERRFARRES